MRFSVSSFALPFILLLFNFTPLIYLWQSCAVKNKSTGTTRGMLPFCLSSYCHQSSIYYGALFGAFLFLFSFLCTTYKITYRHHLKYCENTKFDKHICTYIYGTFHVNWASQNLLTRKGHKELFFFFLKCLLSNDECY